MAYLNKVMLIGNIGKDPEIRMSQQNGRKSVQFSLATSRRYRDNNGEQKEDTQWHSIIGWGKIAETIEQLGIRKGMCLYVEGLLTNRSWKDNQGQTRYMTQVTMETFQILTQRQSNTNGYQSNESQQNNPYSKKNAAAQQEPAYMAGDDDGLPF